MDELIIYQGGSSTESAAALFLFLDFSAASLVRLECGCGSTAAWDRLFRLRDSHTGLNFTSHHDESLLDVLAVLGGCLEETDVVMLGEFLALVSGDLAGVSHIALVANENARDVV